MSQRPETLQLLTEKLQEIRETIDLIVVLDSLGFFSLSELFTKYSQLQHEIQQVKTQYAGGFLHLLEKKVLTPLTSKKINNKIRNIFATA